MNPKNSQDLFNKIRSQFTNIRLGDENGAATADPSSAVFFEFEFKEDADTFGSVSVSIAEDGTMKVLADFDPKIFEKWTDRTSEITPMPIFGSFTG